MAAVHGKLPGRQHGVKGHCLNAALSFIPLLLQSRYQPAAKLVFIFTLNKKNTDDDEEEEDDGGVIATIRTLPHRF